MRTILAIGLVFALVTPIESFSNGVVLFPGNVAPEDMGDWQPTGSWLALHAHEGIWSLSQTTVSLAPHQKNPDHAPWLLTVSGGSESTVVFLQSSALKPGEVVSVPVNTDRTSFLFRDTSYSLLVKKEKTEWGTANHVYVEGRGRRSILYGNADSYESCESPTLLWAGDIDRDGAPDFIADFSDDSEKNASICVFLSSLAITDGVVGTLACQFYSG